MREVEAMLIVDGIKALLILGIVVAGLAFIHHSVTSDTEKPQPHIKKEVERGRQAEDGKVQWL